MKLLVRINLAENWSLKHFEHLVEVGCLSQGQRPSLWRLWSPFKLRESFSQSGSKAEVLNIWKVDTHKLGDSDDITIFLQPKNLVLRSKNWSGPTGWEPLLKRLSYFLKLRKSTTQWSIRSLNFVTSLIDDLR